MTRNMETGEPCCVSVEVRAQGGGRKDRVTPLHVQDWGKIEEVRELEGGEVREGGSGGEGGRGGEREGGGGAALYPYPPFNFACGWPGLP